MSPIKTSGGSTPPREERCPACGQSSVRFNRGPEALELWRCVSCTIVFLARHQVSRSEVEQLEEQHFADSFVGRQSVWQTIFDRLTIARTLKRILQHKKKGSLLDVGVGYGSLLCAAREAGFECTGVEPSAAIVDYVHRTHQLNVAPAYLEDFSPADGKRFDVVILNHVLEHMENPQRALKHLRSLLADGGLVHIALPNIAAWEARLPGWTSYEPYHLFYFSTETLSSTLEAAGFRVVRVETFEPFSGWFNAIARSALAKTYQETRSQLEETSQTQQPSWKGVVLLSLLNTGRIVTGILSFPLRWIQARAGGGEELIVVATPAE